MQITGKGIIIVKVNDTFNYFNYKDNNELIKLVSRFYKIQKLNDITIVDCEDKELLFIDTDSDLEKLKESRCS